MNKPQFAFLIFKEELISLNSKHTIQKSILSAQILRLLKILRHFNSQEV